MNEGLGDSTNHLLEESSPGNETYSKIPIPLRYEECFDVCTEAVP